MKNTNVTKTKSPKLAGASKKATGKVGGTNAKVSAQTSPKGKVGGISKAPKKAMPCH